ncbi:hypothetical protein Lalb_Chr10g0104941 [Lupinus albus]|uniref:Uncharacterized protein n=1 Tax=Lupinus albus TaxID=3870 RepID=A0A6A4PWU7_LUPAL|nr:hypothetical protein Lalb_Chr10g0104941 [Lupinus albus]
MNAPSTLLWNALMQNACNHKHIFAYVTMVNGKRDFATTANINGSISQNRNRFNEYFYNGSCQTLQHKNNFLNHLRKLLNMQINMRLKECYISCP